MRDDSHLRQLESNMSKSITTHEEWRDIQEYDGYYQVSNEGRIRSVYREVPCGIHGVRKIQGRLLTPAKSTNGYYQVTLTKFNSRTRPLWHRVVSIAFHPEVDGKEIGRAHV